MLLFILRKHSDSSSLHLNKIRTRDYADGNVTPRLSDAHSLRLNNSSKFTSAAGVENIYIEYRVEFEGHMEVCSCHFWNRGQAIQLQVIELFQIWRREYADESFRVLSRGIQQEIDIVKVLRVSALVECDCQTTYYQELHFGLTSIWTKSEFPLNVVSEAICSRNYEAEPAISLTYQYPFVIYIILKIKEEKVSGRK